MKPVRLPAILILVFSILSCVTPEDRITADEFPADGGAAAASAATENIYPAEKFVPAFEEENSGDRQSEAEIIVEDEAALPPLGDSDFLRTVQDMMPWNMKAVMDGPSPLVIVHDLDKNGYNDALVVAIEGDDTAETQLSELSKPVRLFQSGSEYSEFLLLIFYQHSGDVVLRYTVPVSRKLVFSGVEPFEIKKGSDFPYALKFTFRTRAGIEQDLVILSGYGITHLTLRENLSEITLIEDIDEDGYEDVIVHEQGFEEGTGYETFLTWYKWNLREYSEYRSTNIVRNLRQFYIVCAEYLRAGDYAEFLEYALDSEALSELKKQELPDSQILEKIFKPAVVPAVNDDVQAGGVPDAAESFFSEEGFTAVVFPEIMETPFSYANRNNFSHQVSVRFRSRSGESRICLAELNMKKNPFQDKQFCFSYDFLR